MKLPKPGNMKLSKPGKLPKTGNLPKPGKLPGGLKLPAFHMKNGFLKKNLITLIAAAVLIIGTGTAYGTLSTREADRGYDPVSGVNEDRYQVLVSGEGYKLTKMQEKNYKLQKKQNETNAAQAAQRAAGNPTTIRTANGTRVYRTSNYRYHYRGNSSFRSTGTVFISTNIYSQKSAKSNWKAGDEFSFMVTAYTYKNGRKTTLSKDNIKVTASKGTLTHTGSKDGNQKYKLVLGEGMNSITVSAKDPKSKKKSKNSYVITASKGSSSGTNQGGKTENPADPKKPDPNTEDKKETVNVGYELDSQKITITDDTRAIDVLSKTKGVGVNTDSEEVEYVTGDMSKLSFDEFFDDDGEQEYLQQVCEKEKQSYIEEEIIKELKSQFEKKPEEGMTEEEYIAAHFDESYESYMNDHFEDIYENWLDSIKKELKDKYFKKNTKIKTGEKFHGYTFKWVYDKVKGKNVKTKINLRLILEKIEEQE